MRRLLIALGAVVGATLAGVATLVAMDAADRRAVRERTAMRKAAELARRRPL